MNAVLLCYLYYQMYETDLIFEEFISYFMFIFGPYSGDICDHRPVVLLYLRPY